MAKVYWVSSYREMFDADKVAAYSMPAILEQVDLQRTLVRHSVSRDLATLLINDMKTAIEYLTSRSKPEAEAKKPASALYH